jgi:probable rRNA maturation factor
MILSRQKKLKVDIKRAKTALERLLEHIDCKGREVNVLLLDDEGIRAYNKEYLGRDRPTNVIAFPMQEGDFGDLNPDILGDILISVETAQREAVESSIPFAEMVDYLMIHGLLHLLGYDHETDRSAGRKMKKKEEELFFSLYRRSITAGD